MKLEVPAAMLTQMIDDIEDSFPNEACGLLFGKVQDSATRFMAQEVQKLENISERPEISFVVDPEVLYKALCTFEARGMSLVAIYHSHQAPLALSRHDLHYMEGYPGIVWLVFSTLHRGLNFPFAAFILKRDAVFPVTVQIL